MSPNLRRAILVAVGERVADKELLPRVLHDLDLGFATLADSRRKRKLPLDDRDEFDALEAASEQAKAHFIITDSPAETTESRKADRLSRQLLTNLRLLARGRNEEAGRGAQYMFHFPERSVGILFWEALEGYLLEVLGKPREEVEARLLRVERDQRLLAFELSAPFLYVFPTVVFDPESEGRTGFILYHHDKGRVSVARMPPPFVKKWWQDIYCKIRANDEPFRRKRIRYQDYLDVKSEER